MGDCTRLCALIFALIFPPISVLGSLCDCHVSITISIEIQDFRFHSRIGYFLVRMTQVLLVRGCGCDFLLNIILTLLAYIPGKLIIGHLTN